MCGTSDEECVKRVQAEAEQKNVDCLPNCSGLLVTSYIKTMNDNDAEHVTPKLFEQYNNYKQFVEFPAKLKSIHDQFQCDKMFLTLFF